MDPSVQGTGQLVLSRASAAPNRLPPVVSLAPWLWRQRMHCPARKQLCRPGHQHRSSVVLLDPELGTAVGQSGRPAAGLYLQERLVKLDGVRLALVQPLSSLCRTEHADHAPPGQRQYPGLLLFLRQQRHVLFALSARPKYAGGQRDHRVDGDPARRHELQVRQHGGAASIGNRAGVRWTLTWDAAFDLVQAIQGPLGRRTSFVYNASNFVRRIVDPGGRITTLTVNASSDLTQIVSPQLCVISLIYDGSHHLLAWRIPWVTGRRSFTSHPGLV